MPPGEKPTPEGKNPPEKKEIKVEATKEELVQLKKDLASAKVSEDPAELDVPDRKLNKKEDTLAGIFKKIFPNGIPAESFTLVEKALTKGNVQLSEINADSWRVLNGHLIFSIEQDGKKYDTWDVWLFPEGLKAAAVEGKTDKNEEKAPEKKVLVNNFYNLGEYEGGEVIMDGTVSVVGGADATRHDPNFVRKLEWYQKKERAASWLLDLYQTDRGHLDSGTVDRITSLESVLKKLAGQTITNVTAFRNSFEKSESPERIFGAQGVYNLLLMYQRVLVLFKRDNGSLRQWLGKDDNRRVSLVVGTGQDKRDERFSKALNFSFEPGKEPLPTPQEGATSIPPKASGLVPVPVQLGVPKQPSGGQGQMPPRGQERADSLPSRQPGPKPEPSPKPRPEPGPAPQPSVSPEIARDQATHLRVTERKGRLTPSVEQFQESLDSDIMSSNLFSVYATGDREAFFESTGKIPSEKLGAVLGKLFQKIGEQDPQKALQLLVDIVRGKREELRLAALKGLEESIAQTSGDLKKLLEFQKIAFMSERNAGNYNELMRLFKQFESIDKNQLPPEMQKKYESQREYFDYFMKRNVAVDLVESALGILQTSFRDEDALKNMQSEDEQEIAEEFKNMVDTDAEVFVASSHVLEALRLALLYQYPKDLQAGKKIENPIKYYFEQIANKTLTTIDVPPGSDLEMDDPLGRKTKGVITGSRVDLTKLFVDPDEEVRLFKEYQSGDEDIDGVDAFLEDEFGGLIEGSDQFFKEKFFEQGGVLGTVEKVRLLKIKALIGLKHYDEARELCIQILEEKLKQQKDLKQEDVEKKADELDREGWGTKITAQWREQLKKVGIESSAEVKGKNIINPKTGKAFDNLTEYVSYLTRFQLEKRARLLLQSEEVGYALWKNDALKQTFSPFEKEVLEEFKELNGYGIGDWKEENWDTAKDVAQTFAEIVAIELLTAGVGIFVAGAVGMAEAGAVGARAFSVLRGTRAGAALFRTGTRVGGKLGHLGRFGKGVRFLAEGGPGWKGFASRRALNAVHGIWLTESMSMLHGEVVNPLSGEGLYQLGATILTIESLGLGQSLLRGEVGALRKAGELKWSTAGVKNKTLFIASRPLAAFNLFGKEFKAGSEVLARGAGRLGARAGRIGEAVVSTGAIMAVEVPFEMIAMYHMAEVEEELGVWTGLLEQDQVDAMKDPETWREWAHTAAVVLPLRAMRIAAPRERAVLRDEPPPSPRDEPSPPPRDEPPPPPRDEPPPPPRDEPPPRVDAIPPGRFEAGNAHDVDIIASGVSANREAVAARPRLRGLPERTVKVKDTNGNSRELNIEPILGETADGKSLRTHYEEALRIPEEAARAERLAQLDRLAGERLILREGGAIEYSTRAEAEQAREGILKDAPTESLEVLEVGGKSLLRRTQAPHDVDVIAKALSEARESAGTGAMPKEVKIGDQIVNVESILEQNVGGKTLREQYQEAYGKADEAGQKEAAAKVDRLLAERAIVSSEGSPEYASVAEAELAERGMPDVRFDRVDRGGGKTALRRAEVNYEANVIANVISKNRFEAGTRRFLAPEGTIKIGSTDVSVEPILERVVSGKKIRDMYQEAGNITDPAVQKAELARIDRIFSERAVIMNGGTVEYPTRAQAEAAKTTLSGEFTDLTFGNVQEAGGKFYVSATPATPPAVPTAGSGGAAAGA